MRTIKRPVAFKKDYKRIASNPRHAHDIEQLLGAVLLALATDTALPDTCRDHALVGDWKGYRECHIKPDLLLIYKTEEPDVLHLARLGSHSELFTR